MFKSIEEMTAKLKFRNTIGFFGDSFCADLTEKSWTTILANKLQADIINFGKNGSSFWTAILDFLNTENIPDYVIFCWTNHRRLYHPTKIANLSSCKKDSKFDDAVMKYFLYLWNEKKEILNYKWTLEYFDQNILSKIKKKTKIIQIFSFTPQDSDIDVNITLQTGKIIKESLMQFSGYNINDHINNNLYNKELYNHMSMQKNQELAEYIYSKF